MDIVQEDINILKKSVSNEGFELENQTVLVTGGAGFLGSWICDLITSLAGRVICLDNLSSGTPQNINHLLKSKNFILKKGDVRTFSTDEEIDYIIHMACIASPPLYQKYPIETLETSIFGTKNILNLAREKDVKGMLFTSTSEIYGDAKVFPTPEDYWGNVNPVGPRAIYDEGKRVAETYCYTYFEKYGLPIRTSRIFNTYGPKLDTKGKVKHGRVIARFILQALNKDPITLFGDGSQTRSFCYITDLIDGLMKLLLKPNMDGEIVNIGNDEEVTMMQLANIVINQTQSNSEIIYKPLPTDDPTKRNPDISKAKTMLDWTPKISLNEGIMKTIEWYREK